MIRASRSQFLKLLFGVKNIENTGLYFCFYVFLTLSQYFSADFNFSALRALFSARARRNQTCVPNRRQCVAYR